MGRGEGLARERVTVGALAEQVRPVTLARDRQLPVLPALEPLLPGGALRRGGVVAVEAAPGATGATTLALALAAGASQAGSWVAAVGLDSLGLVAAAKLGVALDRLVLVADPAVSAGDGRGGAAAGTAGGTAGGAGGEGRGVGWATVTAALVDGFDVVLVAAGPGVRRRAADTRRLVARVRERGAVLLAVGGELPGQASGVRLHVTSAAWQGLHRQGRLTGRRVGVAASGRGEASRPRWAELWLPGADGEVATAEPTIEPHADPIPLGGHRSAHRSRRPAAPGSGGEPRALSARRPGPHVRGRGDRGDRGGEAAGAGSRGGGEAGPHREAPATGVTGVAGVAG